MTREEFDRIVAEAVTAGASKADAEAYVVRGYKLDGVPKKADKKEKK